MYKKHHIKSSPQLHVNLRLKHSLMNKKTQ